MTRTRVPDESSMNRQILFDIISIKNPPFLKTTYRIKYIIYN